MFHTNEQKQYNTTTSYSSPRSPRLLLASIPSFSTGASAISSLSKQRVTWYIYIYVYTLKHLPWRHLINLKACVGEWLRVTQHDHRYMHCLGPLWSFQDGYIIKTFVMAKNDKFQAPVEFFFDREKSSFHNETSKQTTIPAADQNNYPEKRTCWWQWRRRIWLWWRRMGWRWWTTMTFISYDLNWFQLLEQSLSLSTCCDGSGAPKPSSVWSPDPMMFLTFPDPSSGAQPPMSRDTRSATKFEKHCKLVKLFKNKRFRSSCTFKTAVDQTGHLKKSEVKNSPKPFWMVQGYRP